MDIGTKPSSQLGKTLTIPLVDGKEVINDFSYDIRNQQQNDLERGIEYQKYGYILSQKNQQEIYKEFEDLWQITYTKKGHQQNLIEIMEGNRYCDIFPYKHTRIHTDFHINANYINSVHNKQTFIAAQGPTCESLYNFCQLIFQQPINIVIMLCGMDLNGNVCAQYFCDELLEINDFQIQCLEKICLDKLIKRRISIKKKGKIKIIEHYQYVGWPDNQTPPEEDSKLIIQLLEILHQNQYYQDNLSLIHCSAGIGRTGTIIALENIFTTLKYYKENHIKNGKISIFGIVRRLREQRIWMVQTHFQYYYVYQFTNLLIKKIFSDNKNVD